MRCAVGELAICAAQIADSAAQFVEYAAQFVNLQTVQHNLQNMKYSLPLQRNLQMKDAIFAGLCAQVIYVYYTHAKPDVCIVSFFANRSSVLR